jgi:SPW repeat
MRQIWKNEALTDLVSLLLGAWLFLTPWIFGLVDEPEASWNAWLSGIVITASAVAALVAFAEWEEWINLVLGIWLIVSPWLVGFSQITTAVHVFVGVIVAVSAAIRLWFIHQGPPHVTT